jgi:hypothetical protein
MTLVECIVRCAGYKREGSEVEVLTGRGERMAGPFIRAEVIDTVNIFLLIMMWMSSCIRQCRTCSLSYLQQWVVQSMICLEDMSINIVFVFAQNQVSICNLVKYTDTYSLRRITMIDFCCVQLRVLQARVMIALAFCETNNGF